MHKRGWVLAAALLIVGCNPLAVPIFLFGPEPKRPALYQQLYTEHLSDEEKEIKVAVLTYAPLESRPEFMRSDRELSVLVTRHLQETCSYNKEKVKVIDPRKVEEFKNNHPDWKQLDPEEIGKQLKVDAVVVLEVKSLSLYEKGNEHLYRGRAEVGVSLVRINDPDALLLPPRDFICTYPGESKGGFLLADMDKPPEAFKAEFLNVVARKVAWHFTPHPTSQDYLCE